MVEVEYPDGESKTMTVDKFPEFSLKSKTPVGSVGFKFVKKFVSSVFSGKVLRVLPNIKCLCEFCNGEQHSYSMNQLKKY